MLTETIAGSGDLFVRSVEVPMHGFVHKLVFNEDRDHSEVFVPELANMLGGYLSAENKPGLTTAPDMILDLPGAVLGRLRVLRIKGAQGRMQVFVRFAYFIGGIQAAFRDRTCFDTPTLTHREALATAILTDICMPTLDLAALSAATGAGDTTQERMVNRLEDMQRRQDDLVFYVELLKRYVQHHAPPIPKQHPFHQIDSSQFS
ncbi:MAG: hypothetical protein AAGF71_04640 [Pseudomonadota bacterium]